MNWTNEIQQLKREKNAVILVHYYTLPEVQDVADCLGDSLVLAQFAQKTNADVIIFAGVYFMAETAKILNPTKKVYIPDLESGCSLSDSCPADEFALFKKQYPDYKVISYINCSAAVKTMSDVICTSSNALNIVNSFDENEKLIFAPDKNLGAYINNISGRDMALWNGNCHVHNALKAENIIELQTKYPDALLIAHPECQQVVLQFADFIGSTTQLLDFTKKSDKKQFIVATETGILHQMKRYSPDKEFFIVAMDVFCNCNDCEYMKLNTLEKIYNCLAFEKNEVLLDEEIINKAKVPILKMMDLSGGSQKL
ncbi:MAG: quinolinate synthase NadA [Bacteroidales bacterium]|jgi:quinolinate synthase|nr:quinolinate synthase NadA [Bacteroidales bacterium]